MSTLSLAKNGYVSSSKRTNHIKAKYFFVRHFHNNHELDLQYCPTEHMWADIITKPLQGPKFRSIRALSMNCPINYSEDPPFLPSPEPTLAPSRPSRLMTSSPRPSPLPTPSPSSALMKTQAPGPHLHHRSVLSHLLYLTQAVGQYSQVLYHLTIKSNGRMHYFHVSMLQTWNLVLPLAGRRR